MQTLIANREAAYQNLKTKVYADMSEGQAFYNIFITVLMTPLVGFLNGAIQDKAGFNWY